MAVCHLCFNQSWSETLLNWILLSLCDGKKAEPHPSDALSFLMGLTGKNVFKTRQFLVDDFLNADGRYCVYPVLRLLLGTLMFISRDLRSSEVDSYFRWRQLKTPSLKILVIDINILLERKKCLKQLELDFHRLPYAENFSSWNDLVCVSGSYFLTVS